MCRVWKIKGLAGSKQFSKNSVFPTDPVASQSEEAGEWRDLLCWNQAHRSAGHLNALAWLAGNAHTDLLSYFRTPQFRQKQFSNASSTNQAAQILFIEMMADGVSEFSRD